MLVGLVGKPNVGKSTFFHASTLVSAPTGNYPFVTIKPNHATAYVKVECASKFFNVTPNPREGYYVDGWRFVPVELMDVAGLVPGAHEGQGMGNAFLDDLRQADVLIHVIDAAGGTNEKGEPVEMGTYDPANDIKFLEEELDMWYLGIIKKGWEKFARTVQQTSEDLSKALGNQLSGLKVTEDMVKDTLRDPAFDGKITEWNDETIKLLATKLREQTKPIVIAANRMDVPIAKENVARLQKEFPNYKIIGSSAASEVALREAAKAEFIKYVPGENKIEMIKEMTDDQKKGLQFIQDSILTPFGTTGVQDILNYAVFDLLKYMPIYPGSVSKLGDSKGNILPDCFLLPVGSTALDFAFKLHTDFGNNFIRAIDVKTKMTVGKTHVLKFGDVVELVVGK